MSNKSGSGKKKTIKVSLENETKSREEINEKLINVQKIRSRTDESLRDFENYKAFEEEEPYLPAEEDVYISSYKYRMPQSSSRTSVLVRDYFQFKAARTIQRFFRGWFVRRMLAKKTLAALIIQRVWRGFYSRRFYYRKLENLVQQRIEEHYYRSATKIQAFWRGFWVRENVHDQYRKKRMQMRAAEDLLHCVAFKLHHLLRTHQIPGIYSLRNSHCLSKVEHLLYAMQFKQFNDRVRKLRTQREHIILEAKHTHGASAFMTEIPYAGPNFEGVCEPKCCELYKDIDADTKMFKILSLYEKAARMDKRLKRVRKLERPLAPEDKRFEKVKKRGDFCRDVIKSMKKWNILASNRVQVDKNVFKNPENVEKFLTEIESMCILQPRCHCKINIEEMIAVGL